ncbi:MAG TPA: hypothetical protein VK667_12200, partial [Ktedonobacteraceae bacterium]|nr:hypothetical protein [Ktedonobacteraceae bacterium]
MIEPVERFCTVYFVKVMSPAGNLWVQRKDYLIHGSSLSLSEYFGSVPVVCCSAVFARPDDGLV